MKLPHLVVVTKNSPDMSWLDQPGGFINDHSSTLFVSTGEPFWIPLVFMLSCITNHCHSMICMLFVVLLFTIFDTIINYYMNMNYYYPFVYMCTSIRKMHPRWTSHKEPDYSLCWEILGCSPTHLVLDGRMTHPDTSVMDVHLASWKLYLEVQHGGFL